MIDAGGLAQKHTLTGYGGVAAVLIALYLGMVVYRGNTSSLLTSLKGEFGYLKWMIALIVLWVIIQEAGGGLGNSIAWLAFLALAISVGGKVFPQISTFFKGK